MDVITRLLELYGQCLQCGIELPASLPEPSVASDLCQLFDDITACLKLAPAGDQFARVHEFEQRLHTIQTLLATSAVAATHEGAKESYAFLDIVGPRCLRADELHRIRALPHRRYLESLAEIRALARRASHDPEARSALIVAIDESNRLRDQVDELTAEITKLIFFSAR